MKKPNKKKNPIARQLRHFKKKVIKNKKNMTEKNSVRFNAEIVNGQCPSCSEVTMLVSVATDYYRCVTCGTDLQQHINGKITYLPILPSNKDYKVYVKDWVGE